jgi:hypothetical protein
MESQGLHRPQAYCLEFLHHDFHQQLNVKSLLVTEDGEIHLDGSRLTTLWEGSKSSKVICHYKLYFTCLISKEPYNQGMH